MMPEKGAIKMLHQMTRSIPALVVILVLFGVACQSEESPLPTIDPGSAETQPFAMVITIGDVEADEPAKKVKRFQPLADYLAKNLADFGYTGGRVILARDIDEMAGFLRDGTVDIYLDSSFPALSVQELSGSQIIARRWKGGDPNYWSIYVALDGNGTDRVEAFLGKVVAFEEPHSTSGFVLPAGTLIQRGFALREVESLEESVAPDEIGYVFSRDEENTIELLLQGRVAGGGISNQDYEGLPEELKERIKAFDRTIEVPRQLVTVRPGLDEPLVDRITELLLALEQTEEGRELLEGLKSTKKFDRLPPESEASLAELRELMRLVSTGP